MSKTMSGPAELTSKNWEVNHYGFPKHRYVFHPAFTWRFSDRDDDSDCFSSYFLANMPEDSGLDFCAKDGVNAI